MQAIALPLNVIEIHIGTPVSRICYKGKRKEEPKTKLFIITHNVRN
jgi:hypothetical protein